MAEAQSLPLLSQYSDAFTQLHDGKKRCMDYGMDRVALNRYVVDAATSTSQQDPSALLSMVDPDLVEEGVSPAEKQQHCKDYLSRLVALQEEVNTLQKVAREKGIAGGLLNIVGQASIQSPDDHGASVIHQLSALMDDNGKTKPTAAIVDGVSVVETSAAEPGSQPAANDVLPQDDNQPAGIAAWLRMAKQDWKSLSVDVLFCLAASFFAISLVS
jgi:hypothetical protein